MMIIRFFERRTLDSGSRAEVLEYAVNDAGLIIQKLRSKGNIGYAIPEPEAFTNVTVLGLAQFSNRPARRTGELLYDFSEMTPALIDTLVYGPISDQKYTIITEELGTKTCWSRGIKHIYFV